MKKEYDFGKGRRGPVIEPPPGKTRITIRLDDDVLEWFRAQADASGGASYQTMINQALREFMASRREPIEEAVRRVVREELVAYGSEPRRGRRDNPTDDVEALAAGIAERFAKKGISREDVEDAIRWARSRS